MIYMHSKYDNMHKNKLFNALIYINNCIITCYQAPSLIFLLPWPKISLHLIP